MNTKTSNKGRPLAVILAVMMLLTMIAGLRPKEVFAATGNGCYSLKGAVYGVYKTKAAAQAATNSDRGDPVAVITTIDENGNTDWVTDLEEGTYYIKELKAPTGYWLDTTVYSQKVEAGGEYTVPVKDQPMYGSIGVFLKKVVKKGNKIADHPANTSDFAGVTFDVKYYDNTDGTVSGSPTRTWVLKTNANGELSLNDSTIRVSGDALYKDSGNVVWPLGTYTFKEKEAPDGYLINTTTFKGIIKPASGASTDSTDPQPVVQFASSTNVEELTKNGDVQVYKVDADTGERIPQGDAKLAGAVFSIINKSGKNVFDKDLNIFADGAEVTTITADASGLAKTTGGHLQAGTYLIKEKAAPTGYLINSSWSQTFEITKDGQVVTLKDDDALPETPLYGELTVYKVDANTGKRTPQGDAKFVGAKFEVINRSDNPVIVKGQTTEIPVGGTVMTITADMTGEARTGKVLPYGTYEMKEIQAPEGYLLNTTWSDEKELHPKSSDTASFTVAVDPETEAVKRGGGVAVKFDEERNEAIPQGDATLQGAVFSIINRSANPVYVGGAEKAVGAEVMTITTNAQGVATTGNKDLPYGTYELKEKTAPTGYLLNETYSKTFKIQQDGVIVEINNVKNPLPQKVKRGGVKVQKIDADTGKTSPQGNGDFAGIKINITNRSTNAVKVDGTLYNPGSVVKTITTGKNGVATTGNRDLPFGTYELTEANVGGSIGYNGNSTWKETVTIREDGVIVSASKSLHNPVKRFGLKIQKHDNDLSTNYAQGNATLEGAEFTITNKSAASVVTRSVPYLSNATPVVNWSASSGSMPSGAKEVAVDATVGVLKTDASGAATTLNNDLSYGTYVIKETKASNGYNLNNAWTFTVKVYKDGNTDKVNIKGTNNTEAVDETINFSDNMIVDLAKYQTREAVIRGGIQIVKRDKELAKSEALGGADLNDIVFTIKNTSNHDVVVRKDTFKIDLDQLKTTYDLLTDDSKITESELLAGKPAAKQIDWSKLVSKADLYNKDIKRVAPGQDVGKIVAHWNAEKNAYTAETLSDDLPYGTYTIRESRTNDKYQRTDKTEHAFEITKQGELRWYGGNGGDVFVFDNYVYRSHLDIHKHMLGLSESEYNKRGNYIPFKVTQTKTGETHVVVMDKNGDFSTRDTRTTDFLEEDEDAVNETKINPWDDLLDMVKKTETTDTSADTQNTEKQNADDQNNDQNADDQTTDQNTTEQNTTEQNTDAQGAATDQTTDDQTTDAQDAATDQTTDDQTTDAQDAADDQTTDNQNTEAQSDEDLLDGVISDELIASRSNDLNQPIWFHVGELGSDNAGYNAKWGALPWGEYEIEELPSTSNMGYELAKFTITVDQKTQEGQVDVDVENTPTTPKIATTATAGGHKTAPATKNVTITDNVTLKNLTAEDYKLVGVLMDKDANAPVATADGKDVTASTEFKGPKTKITMDFTFDATGLNNHDLVVFEKLYVKDGGSWKEVANHEDMSDEGQTVHIPDAVTTSAWDEKDGDVKEFTISEGGTVEMFDTIHYKNLVPGQKYTATGYLFDADTLTALSENPSAKKVRENDVTETIRNEDGSITVKTLYATKQFETLDGSNVDLEKLSDLKDAIAATAEFTPKDKDGEVVVKFTFNKEKLIGRRIVTFEDVEEIVPGDKPYRVAVHAQWDDESQITYIPDIGTVATIDGKNSGIKVGEFVTLADTVEYTALEPGKQHTVKGKLMNKSTGKAAVDSDGKEITAEATFTPDGPDGSVIVNFTFNAKWLYGESLVAFETMYDAEGNVVARHEDIEDEDQTVTFEEVNPKYDMYKIRSVSAGVKPGTEKYGFRPGETVTYDVVVRNLGNIEITTDVTDEFEEAAKAYFTDPVVKEVKNAKQNSISADKNRVNITVEAGETATVVYESTVKQGAKEYLADDPNDSDSLDKDGNPVNKDNEANKPKTDGYKNTAKTENPTYPDPKDPPTPDNPNKPGKPVPGGPKDDPAETPVREPEIGTYLSDKAGRKDVDPSGKTVFDDVVSYSGLTPGREYAVVGTLMLKDKNDPLVENGEPVKAVGVFKPEKENGDVTVEFTVDTTKIAGKEIVAFEVCYDVTGKDIPNNPTPNKVEEEGTPVAEHKDINDPSQTVKINKPEIGTYLADNAEKQKVNPSGKTVLIDTVKYKGLAKGETYVVVGELMLKDTGDPLVENGQKVKAMGVFVPASESGETTVEFVVDTTGLVGKEIVAFETAYNLSGVPSENMKTIDDVEKNGTKVAEHKDLNDKSQTVKVKTPKIGTILCDNEGRKTIGESESVTLVDTITYEGLAKGEPHAAIGTLVDKETGTLLEERAIGYFTPRKTSGRTEVIFVLSTEGMTGKKLVAFEKVYNLTGLSEGKSNTIAAVEKNGKLVATHEDLKDKDQTVTVAKNPGRIIVNDGPSPKTGDYNNIALYGFTGALGALLAAVLAMLKRRKDLQK